MRIIAIDWSGARQNAGKTIWLAEARDGRLARLENGRDREAIADHLIAEARRDPALVVGFDFAFSLPAWFLDGRGLAGRSRPLGTGRARGRGLAGRLRAAVLGPTR